MSETIQFDDYSTYRATVLDFLLLAQREVILYEQDFRHSDLGSRACETELTRILSAPGGVSVRLLACRPDYLAQHCPRLLRLREQFGHRLSLHCLDETRHSDLERGFMLADGQWSLVRHHFDWPRGELREDSRLYAQLQQQFDSLWEHSAIDPGWLRLHL